MDRSLADVTVLIVEDGDEYRSALSRYVVGPRYLQAHDGAEALRLLGDGGIDVIYLDMCFDRTPRERLLGDPRDAARRHGGPERGYRYLAEHQGLFILQAVHETMPAPPPVILAHDFERQPERFTRLSSRYPALRWIGDGASADEIRAELASARRPHS